MKAITQDWSRPSLASCYGNYKCFPILMCSQTVAVLKRDMVKLLLFCLVWKHTDCLGISWRQCSVQRCPFWANIRKTVWNLNAWCSVLLWLRLTVCLLVCPSVRPSVCVWLLLSCIRSSCVKTYTLDNLYFVVKT